MIVVDILGDYGERGSQAIERKLLGSPCVMSAATRVELGIVIESRAGAEGAQLLQEMLSRIEVRILPADTAIAVEAIIAWRRFGKGRHPASLNYGDTFAYALARRSGLPLLFVGDDFAQTDVLVA